MCLVSSLAHTAVPWTTILSIYLEQLSSYLHPAQVLVSCAGTNFYRRVNRASRNKNLAVLTPSRCETLH